MEEKRQLKSGFTTGTCAAAAAMAAAQALAGGRKREYVSLMTPGGREAAFEVLWQPECVASGLVLKAQRSRYAW